MMTTLQLQELLAIIRASGAGSVTLESPDGTRLSASFGPTPGESEMSVKGEAQPKFTRPRFPRSDA